MYKWVGTHFLTGSSRILAVWADVQSEGSKQSCNVFLRQTVKEAAVSTLLLFEWCLWIVYVCSVALFRATGSTGWNFREIVVVVHSSKIFSSLRLPNVGRRGVETFQCWRCRWSRWTRPIRVIDQFHRRVPETPTTNSTTVYYRDRIDRCALFLNFGLNAKEV